jgi:hypothetical protein
MEFSKSASEVAAGLLLGPLQSGGMLSGERESLEVDAIELIDHNRCRDRRIAAWQGHCSGGAGRGLRCLGIEIPAGMSLDWLLPLSAVTPRYSFAEEYSAGGEAIDGPANHHVTIGKIFKGRTFQVTKTPTSRMQMAMRTPGGDRPASEV